LSKIFSKTINILKIPLFGISQLNDILYRFGYLSLNTLGKISDKISHIFLIYESRDHINDILIGKIYYLWCVSNSFVNIIGNTIMNNIEIERTDNQIDKVILYNDKNEIVLHEQDFYVRDNLIYIFNKDVTLERIVDTNEIMLMKSNFKPNEYNIKVIDINGNSVRVKNVNHIYLRNL
jgi:hypothetical protein